MYQRDWLDDLRWSAVLAGVLVAVAAQLLLTAAVLGPAGGATSWAAVGLVELCVAAGAFVSGWWARQAAVVNGVVAAALSAAISLAATAVRTPSALNLLSILFLFGTFVAMGALGGLLAGYLRARRAVRRR